MRNVLRTAVALSLLPFLLGCGVIIGGTRQSIRLMSSPEGTSVDTAPPTITYKTPTTLNLERRNEYVLTFSMPGYTSQQVELQRSMRTGILIADILLTGLIGVVVDAATGAWYRLSPEFVTATLTQTSAGPGPASITVTVNTTSGKAGDQLEILSTAPGVNVDVGSQ